MDRISNLPDEIIWHIGSFLSAKEAAFATVLSKRWRDLFTVIPEVHFNGSVNDGGSFKEFVDLVLALPVSSRVRKFSLKCKHVAQYEEDLINRCLLYVVKLGVLILELQIKLTRKGSYSLPFEVFTCKTVSTMKLGSGFAIDLLPADVFLPALKSLFLDYVQFYGFGGRCAFKTLLSASPVLEELVIDNIDWERWKWSFTISSPTLQRLTIRRKEWYSYYESHQEETIRLDSRGLAYDFDTMSFDTPGLTYLEYSDYVPKEYLIVNLNSLVEAKLNLCAEEHGAWTSNADADIFNPMNLINGLRKVEILNLTFEAVEMFEVYRESIPVFEKVSQLTLGLSNSHWFSVPTVMKKLPNLKTLILEDSLHDEQQTDIGGWPCECVSEYSFLLSCHVEVLKINEYRGSKGELEQMKHILGKLSSLELVEVRVQVSSSDAKLKIMADLLMLPRASIKCKIQVKFSRMRC